MKKTTPVIYYRPYFKFLGYSKLLHNPYWVSYKFQPKHMYMPYFYSFYVLHSCGRFLKSRLLLTEFETLSGDLCREVGVLGTSEIRSVSCG